MRCIVGTQLVASGSVTVLGATAGASELRRRVSYVTQAPSVYADLTALENLRYFARILRAPRGDDVRVLDEVGLRADAHRPARWPVKGAPCSSPATSWTRPSAAGSWG